MTELIQLTIRRALKDGSMYTKQWQLEPLLPLPSTQSNVNDTVNGNDNDNSKDAFVHRHNSSSSHSSFNSSSSTNHNNSHSHIHNNTKGKSFSYLDAVKGKNNNNNNNKRKSWSGDHLNNNQNNNYNTSSGNNNFINNNGIQTKKKKKNGNSSSYEETLPVNDSYYGSPATASSKYNATPATVTATTTAPPQYPYHASPKASPLKKYDAMLPSNDSYYGRSTSMTSTSSTSTSHNGYPYTSDANNISSGNNDTDTNDDFISLSSLSTTKYIKKNNKLIKASSHSSSISNYKSSPFEKSKNKKKKGKGMTATKSNNNTTTTTSSKSKLASRLNRFSGQGGLSDAASSNLHSEYSQGVERYMGKTVIGGTTSTKKLDEEDYENMTVKGTCVTLEKEYLRLTAPPRAELVRPQPILHSHLVNLKNQWNQYRNATATTTAKMTKATKTMTTTVTNSEKGKDKKKKKKQKDYAWFCSQLKAIRQDLTVQRIFNAFAVDVYETHAKFALIEGDLNEYNQSQTQLKELYELVSHRSSASSEDGKSNSSSPKGKGIDIESDSCNGNVNADNKANENDNGLKNQNEFIAYRIIYYVLLTGNKKYEGGSSDIFKIMLNLTPEQRKDPSIVHALKVRVAVADNDYHAFFRLQDTCPNIGSYLMDMMLDHVRGLGLQCMVKAYRPSLSTHFMLEELGFSFNGELDVDEGITWLKNYGCKFNEDESLVLTKDSVLNESNLIGKKVSSLI